MTLITTTYLWISTLGPFWKDLKVKRRNSSLMPVLTGSHTSIRNLAVWILSIRTLLPDVSTTFCKTATPKLKINACRSMNSTSFWKECDPKTKSQPKNFSFSETSSELLLKSISINFPSLNLLKSQSESTKLSLTTLAT